MPIGDEKAAAVQKSPSDFQDWVDFHYRDDVPLISSSGKCVDLVRQIRGGSRGMSDVDDLIFANDYVGAAKTSIQLQGRMNNVIEKYDTALKKSLRLVAAKDAVLDKVKKDRRRVSGEAVLAIRDK
ncbi:unnamed protein product [Brassica oleracea var. botrytis]|uniref:Uncharacterized protein n=2 Tax=Brassica TaxID=3705 RepID=A0A3P6DYY6_BRAOL|nr:unnamed protein product [Brassica napus]CDY65165.1 BnaC09g52790D [Brassica napus]VDD31196.1 unnamed protein product [Brassica oleracea]